MLESRHSESNNNNRAHSGEIFRTKLRDAMGRVDLFSESGENYLPRGTMLVFDKNIKYVTEGGAANSFFRKATIMGEDVMRLPDGKDISVYDLVPNQTARVVLSSDIVNEDLRRDGIVEI